MGGLFAALLAISAIRGSRVRPFTVCGPPAIAVRTEDGREKSALAMSLSIAPPPKEFTRGPPRRPTEVSAQRSRGVKRQDTWPAIGRPHGRYVNPRARDATVRSQRKNTR